MKNRVEEKELTSGRRPMDARERAVWEDAEGSLYVPEKVMKGRSPRLRTSQMERGILLDYYVGAMKDGVRCSILTNIVKKTVKTPRAYTFYETQVSGLANIAQELRLTSPYRRSAKLANQIRRFKEFLGLSRKRMRRSLVEARELSLSF